MKLQNGRYQTATQVKVLSPVITNVKEADSLHLLEGNTIYLNKAREKSLFRGLSPWYDIERKLQELGRSKLSPQKWKSDANLKKKEIRNNSLEVGLIHSRGVTGVMPCEANSHSKGLALVCKGKGKHEPTNELEETCLRN